ncbi:MAG: SCP2 domain-containing protein [Kiloniellales bacterium]
MSQRRHQSLPLSPVLFAGFALRSLPTALFQPFLSRAMGVMYRRHRDVFRRMESLRDTVFLIEPVDLPFRFLLRPAAPRPVLRLVAEGKDAGTPSAIIRGPLLTLIDLLEGRLDGDAMFFTRDLVIEGDTEAVVTLRNAVDSGEINLLEDMLAPLGPFLRPLARHGLAVAGALFARAGHDLETLHAAVVAPVARRCELLATDLQRLERQVTDLRRQMQRRPSAGRRRGGTAGEKHARRAT